jgi:hypothetical protein
MTFPVVLAALMRRELGRGGWWQPVAWAVAGAGAALLNVRMRGVPAGSLSFMVMNFEAGLSFILAATAAYRIMSRAAADHGTGWVRDWCGSGGGRDRYIIALGAAVLAAALVSYVAGVGAYAATRAWNGADDVVVRTALETVRGAGRIAAVCGFGLVFAAATGPPGAMLAVAITVFVASPVAVLFVVVYQDLPAVPEWARLAVLHLPPVNPSGTNGTVVLQAAYVLVAGVVAAAIANRRVGRVA